MIARVVRILFVAWFVLLAGLVALARSTDWTPGCCIGLYLLLFGHPTLLAIEMLLARHIAARSDAPRARWRDLPRAVLRNRGLWNPWMRRLRRLDRAFVAVNLEPVFTTLDEYVPQVERAVRRMETATGLAPVIVAHSMGGLVARAWLRSRATHKRSDGTAEAARLITIGTPHRGTWLARLARPVNARQMRIGSRWLTTLTGREPPTLQGLITSWWSECDQIVYPPPTAVFPGSEAKQLRGVGHIALTAREEIWNEIRRRIDY